MITEGEGVRERKSLKDVVLLALKMEDGTISHGMRAISRS